jgi:molybdate transport system substrate-binding protein
MAWIALALSLPLSMDGRASELEVIAGIGLSGALGEVGPNFEKASGYKLVVQYGVPGPLRRMIESGEPFDLAIIPLELLEDLAKAGLFASDRRIQIARSGLGVAIRLGAPKLDLGSTEAFKQ